MEASSATGVVGIGRDLQRHDRPVGTGVSLVRRCHAMAIRLKSAKRLRQGGM